MSQACFLPESVPRKIVEYTNLMKFCYNIKNHDVVLCCIRYFSNLWQLPLVRWYLPVESIRITLGNQPDNQENNMEISVYALKSRNNSTKIHF